MPSLISLMNGISAFVLILCAWFIALFSLYLFYKKNRNQRHISEMLLALAIAIGWTGYTISFFSITIFHYNVPGVIEIISYFPYSMIPIGGFAVLRLVWDMVGSPKSRNKVLIAYLLYSIVYYIVLYTTITFSVDYYNVAGELLDEWLKPTSIMFYLVWVAVIIPAIVAFLGFYKVASITSGDSRKRAMALLITTIGIGSGILLEVVILMGPDVQNIMFLPRILVIIGVIFERYGFRPPDMGFIGE